MKGQNQWRMVVQRIIRSEMSLRGVKYQGLSDKLAEIGVSQTADNLRNKVNKGILGADLLLQILYVLKARPLSAEMMAEIMAAVDGD